LKIPAAASRILNSWVYSRRRGQHLHAAPAPGLSGVPQTRAHTWASELGSVLAVRPRFIVTPPLVHASASRYQSALRTDQSAAQSRFLRISQPCFDPKDSHKRVSAQLFKVICRQTDHLCRHCGIDPAGAVASGSEGRGRSQPIAAGSVSEP
jgi:hypothetical protein